MRSPDESRENEDRQPKTQPAGDRPPPRPPKRTAATLGPDDDDPERRGPATINKAATGEGRFTRRWYGHIVLRIAPNGRNNGNEFLNEVSADVIPQEYVASAIEGVRNAFEYHKMVDIVVHVIGGSFHREDSSELAFKIAGLLAAKEAIKLAGPIETCPTRPPESNAPEVT